MTLCTIVVMENQGGSVKSCIRAAINRFENRVRRLAGICRRDRIIFRHKIVVILDIRLQQGFSIFKIFFLGCFSFRQLLSHAPRFDVVPQQETDYDKNKNTDEQIEISYNYFSVAKFEFRIEPVKFRAFQIDVRIFRSRRFIIFDW